MYFSIFRSKKSFLEIETSLLGKYNASNILAACIVALLFRINPNTIAYAIRKLKPLPHRLEVKTTSSGITIIDDSFNSNPKGAEMALEVLKYIDGNKKVIITPGMVEIGKDEFKYNRIFGKQIASICNYVILVGRKQTLAIQKGLAESNYSDKSYYVAKNLSEANKHLKKIIQPNDVVLYENDLA